MIPSRRTSGFNSAPVGADEIEIGENSPWEKSEKVGESDKDPRFGKWDGKCHGCCR